MTVITKLFFDRMLEELDDDLDRTDNKLKGVLKKVDRALKLSDGQSPPLLSSSCMFYIFRYFV